jgi:23S rRNA (adenine2030-N6)-methyltransferase
VRNLPPLFAKLLTIAESLKKTPDDLLYPGSPSLIQPYLREQDRVILIENHPQAFEELKKNFHRAQKMFLHKRDALEGLNALIPFPEKRGLIFIDPSYEVKTEYQQIANLVIKLHHKFAQGIYVIWYPILPEGFHESLLKIFKNAQIEYWSSQWWPFPQVKTGMIGSGVFVLNPPWMLKEEMTAHFDFLKKACFQESKFRFE